MVKLFRKYNKYILVVGGSLLMVAFLMPQAIEQLAGNRLKETYALMEGRKVTYAEIGRAEEEFRAVNDFNPFLVKQVLGIENSDHWLLLSDAAERAGFVAKGGEDATDWSLLEILLARQMVQQQFRDAANYVFQQPEMMQRYLDEARKYIPEMRERALGKSRLDEKEFDAAVSKARGMLRMIETFNRANVLSDRRALIGEKARFDTTAADVLVIPAQRLVAKVPDPTEEELKAHFERFRTVKKGEGEFGIGYTLPPRLKLEWLTLDKAALGAAIRIDPVEANKRWRTNKDKYKGDFAADKPKVEEDLRAEKVNTILTDADATIRAELRNPLRRLDPDGTYKKLPPDWSNQRPGLEKLAQQVAAMIRTKHGVEAPLPPVTVRSASWLTREDIGQLEKIGTSSIRLGSRMLAINDVVFQLKELLPPGQAAGSDLGLQVGVTSPEIVPATPAGDRIFFTVLDARPESPADSLEEVRTTAVADFKLLKAYELLTAQADQLRDLAVKQDLEAVIKWADEQYPPQPDATIAPAGPATLAVNRNVRFRRDDVSGAGAEALNIPAAREAVEQLAQSLDPTKPGSDVLPQQRTLSVPLPAALSVAVVQLTARRPVIREDLRAGIDRVIQAIQADELRSALTPGDNPFSLEQLADRYAYKIEKQPSEPTKENPPPRPPQPFGG